MENNFITIKEARKAKQGQQALWCAFQQTIFSKESVGRDGTNASISGKLSFSQSSRPSDCPMSNMSVMTTFKKLRRKRCVQVFIFLDGILLVAPIQKNNLQNHLNTEVNDLTT